MKRIISLYTFCMLTITMHAQFMVNGHQAVYDASTILISSVLGKKVFKLTFNQILL